MQRKACAELGRQVIEPVGLASPPGWSHAVSAGGWLFSAGVMATNYQNGLVPEARIDARVPYLENAMDKQAQCVLFDIAKILAAGGCDIHRDLIRLWQWIPASYQNDEDYAKGRPHWPCFPSGTPYARQLQTMVGDARRSSTGIGVRQLPIPDALLSVDLIAMVPRPGLEKQSFAPPPDMPQPKIGYSAATRYGDWIFLAGFGATDFKGDWMGNIHMGEPSLIAPEARVNPYIWLGSEIEAQTDYTLRALGRIAEVAGGSLDRCVKADVTIMHPTDFEGMDRVWRSYFPDNPPARNVVTGAQLVVKGLRVEIALLLLAGDTKLEKTTICAPGRPMPMGHAPQAVRAGEFLFLSGQLPIDATGAVPETALLNPAMPFFHQPIQRQTELILDQVGAICAAGGTSLANVCKVQAFLDDLSGLPGALDVWRRVFPSAPPALSAVAMGGGAPLAAPGAHVQMDVIAYVPK